MAKKKVDTTKLHELKKAELLELCLEYKVPATERTKKDAILEMLTAALKSYEKEQKAKEKEKKAKADEKAKAEEAKKKADEEAMAEKAAKALETLSKEIPKGKARPEGKKKRPKAIPVKAKVQKPEPKREARPVTKELAVPKENIALTGKAKGKIVQLELREERSRVADKLFPADTSSLDSIQILPAVYHDTKSFEDQFATEDDISEEELLLIESMNNIDGILRGEIIGTTQTEYKPWRGKEIAYCCAIVDFEGIEVHIPTYHFWEDWSNERKYPPNRLHQIMQRRVGSIVEFNLLESHVSEVDGRVRYYGTRLLAQRKARAEFWYGTSKDSGDFCVQEGQIRTAQIVDVDFEHVEVSLGGAETRIWIGDITKRYLDKVDDGRTELEVGDIAKIKITKIHRQKMTAGATGFSFPIEFKANMRDAEGDLQAKYYHLFDYGNTRGGVITNITENEGDRSGKKNYFVQASTKPVTILCTLSDSMIERGMAPKKGQEIRYRITKKNEDTHELSGEITRIVRQKKKSDVVFTI